MGSTRRSPRQNKDFKEAKIFLRKWQQEVQKRISEEDRKLAETSRQLRIEGYRELREKQTQVWHGVDAGKLLADVLEADFMEVG